jgi:hypothetical protein
MDILESKLPEDVCWLIKKYSEQFISIRVESFSEIERLGRMLRVIIEIDNILIGCIIWMTKVGNEIYLGAQDFTRINIGSLDALSRNILSKTSFEVKMEITTFRSRKFWNTLVLKTENGSVFLKVSNKDYWTTVLDIDILDILEIQIENPFKFINIFKDALIDTAYSRNIYESDSEFV